MKGWAFKQTQRYPKNIRTATFSFVLCAILSIFIPNGEILASTYGYSFTNDGNIQTIDPLSGEMSATEYYDYYSWDGHPGFGTEPDTAFLWLWEDLETDEVSLGIIFSSPTGNNKGTANMSFGNVPGSATWLVKDDSGDDSSWGDWSVGWRWNRRHTDGGVIGGLANNEWDIEITANSSSGINNWYFLSAGDDKFAHPLDMNNGVTASANAQVPEPATCLLLGFGMVGLFARKIKRRYRNKTTVQSF